MASGGDFESFDFTIIPSSPSQCVINYIITATSNHGSSRDIIVPTNRSIPRINAGGFSVCSRDYTFTVVPVTSEGAGQRRGEYTSGMLCAVYINSSSNARNILVKQPFNC